MSEFGMKPKLIASLSSLPAKYPGNCLSFLLTIINQTSERLLTAFPDITHLRFKDSAGKTRDWGCSSFMSSPGGAILLESRSSDEYRIDAAFDDSSLDFSDDEEDRYGWLSQWSIDLPAGQYQVCYSQKIDESYYDGNSHMTFEHLRNAATSRDATLWTGTLETQTITVSRPTPSGR